MKLYSFHSLILFAGQTHRPEQKIIMSFGPFILLNVCLLFAAQQNQQNRV